MTEVIKKYELKKVELDSTFDAVHIKSSQDSYNFIKQFYQSDIDIYESFFILMLDRRNVTIGFAKISQGGVAGTYIDIKLVAKYAVESLCNGLILAHNHPSGNIQPSNDDMEITKKIQLMFSYHDIKVFDHIIITKNSYYSFADNNLL